MSFVSLLSFLSVVLFFLQVSSLACSSTIFSLSVTNCLVALAVLRTLFLTLMLFGSSHHQVLCMMSPDRRSSACLAKNGKMVTFGVVWQLFWNWETMVLMPVATQNQL